MSQLKLFLEWNSGRLRIDYPHPENPELDHSRKFSPVGGQVNEDISLLITSSFPLTLGLQSSIGAKVELLVASTPSGMFLFAAKSSSKFSLKIVCAETCLAANKQVDSHRKVVATPSLKITFFIILPAFLLQRP